MGVAILAVKLGEWGGWSCRVGGLRVGGLRRRRGRKVKSLCQYQRR